MRAAKFNFLLLFFLILELFFLFSFRIDGAINTQSINSLGSFATSLLFGVIILFKFYNYTIATCRSASFHKTKTPLLVLYAVGTVVLYAATRTIIRSCNYVGFSDIIPNIQILAQRFIEGKTVYAKEAWQSTTGGKYYPFYLPMHWIPFTITEWLHVDPRRIPFLVWMIGAGLIIVRAQTSKIEWFPYTIPILFIFSYLLMANNVGTIIGVTIEPMIIGYYLLFILSLNQNNFLITGLIFTCCLLSRYYIAAWLPLWFFVLFISGRRKELIRTIIATFGFVCLLYIFPFVLKNWEILKSIGNGYDIGIDSEWTKNLNPSGKPWHLYEGNGFAYLVYEKYKSTNLAEGFIFLKKMLMLIPLSSLVVLGGIYWFVRKKLDHRIFLMASFKIYLTIFLSLLMVPYTYLASISIFISIAIFSEQSRYELVETKSEIT